ncbi:MAG: TlpA family protein disulfide reductase [Anaerolineales bacterium]|nr:TlpA family protein disulfide reductase [Chloroflexota bacterium]MBL6982859.1 TlpA family protein disulfide reductase [Anaerolineales bacterium]
MIHTIQRRKNNALPLIFAGAGLILFAIAGIFWAKQSQEVAALSADEDLSVVPVSVEYLVPELVMTDLSGKSVSLADFRGQIVLINNWATWCPPCRAEMPQLEAYYQAHKDQNFTLIGISAGDTQAQVENFVREYALSFPMWIDLESAALSAFRNNSLPSSYVIDKNGTVRLAWSGAISLAMLEEHVTPLLKE